MSARCPRSRKPAGVARWPVLGTPSSGTGARTVIEATAATLCSSNEDKRRELEAALPGWTLRLLGAELPPETGSSYHENARAKAMYGHEAGPRDEWMLGEDSGIEVAALGGAPGINSARWAGEPVSALLAELEGVQDRRARYVCELVAIGPAGEEVRGRGTLEGRIAHEPRGHEGFGYDPVFVPDGEERTVAELGNAWKRANSHRARAAAALVAARGSGGLRQSRSSARPAGRRRRPGTSGAS